MEHENNNNIQSSNTINNNSYNNKSDGTKATDDRTSSNNISVISDAITTTTTKTDTSQDEEDVPSGINNDSNQDSISSSSKSVAVAPSVNDSVSDIISPSTTSTNSSRIEDNISTTNNNSNNNLNNNNNDEDDSIMIQRRMQEMERDIENIEEHLTQQRRGIGNYNRTFQGAGSAFRDSVQSAIGNIRTRLASVTSSSGGQSTTNSSSVSNTVGGSTTTNQQHQLRPAFVVPTTTSTNPISAAIQSFGNPTSTMENTFPNESEAIAAATTTVTATSVRNLSQRLIAAEMAHTNQTQLSRAHNFLRGRSSRIDPLVENTKIDDDDNNNYDDSDDVKMNSSPGSIFHDDEYSPSSPPSYQTTPSTTDLQRNTNRRASVLLPSRRKAEEMDGTYKDLEVHGDAISTISSHRRFQQQQDTSDNENKNDGHEKNDTTNNNDTDDCIQNHDDIETIYTPDDTEGEKTTILLTQRSRKSLRSTSVSVLFPSQQHCDDEIMMVSTTPTAKDTGTITATDATTLPSVATPSVQVPTSSTSSSSTIVYSWGVGIQSLHDTCQDITEPEESLVDATSRVGRSDIVSCSIGPNHVACCDDTGQVFAKGYNVSGAIDPDRRNDEDNGNKEGSSSSSQNSSSLSGTTLIPRPIVIESLGQARIVQVACGVDHTVALRANGTVLTWGSNEYGQLGHNDAFRKQTQYVRPTIMATAGKRITSIAAGDGFTLCLTNRMTVVACGVELLAGYRKDGDIYRPAPLPTLQDLPIVKIAAGLRHAVAITVHGTVFVWGENPQGCCAREYPRSFSIPVPVLLPPSSQIVPIGNGNNNNNLPAPLSHWTYVNASTTTNNSLSNRQSISSFQFHGVALPDDVAVISAALGKDHTVLVTKSGRLFVCGSNRYGQLGLPQSSNTEPNDVYTLQSIVHPRANDDDEIFFTAAEAGENHTLLLDSMGDVWQFGGTNNNNNINNTIQNPVLSRKRIQWIAAGGKNAVAVTTKLNRSVPTRLFSEHQPDDQEYTLDGCVEDLLSSLVDANKMKLSNESTSLSSTEHHPSSIVDTSVTLAKDISNRMQELLKTPAVLNGLFVDPTELDELYTKLLAVDDIDFRKEIVSAIERGTWYGLQTVNSDCTRLVFPEQVRFLLLYLQCPLFVDYWKTNYVITTTTTSTDKNNAKTTVPFDRRGDLILALCEVMLELPYEGYRALMTWATSAYTRDQFVKYILRPLLSQLGKGLSVTTGAETRPVASIVAVLRWLYNAAERTGHTIAKPEDFHCDAISQMHPERLLEDLVKYKKSSKEGRSSNFYLFKHPFLFSVTTKRLLLQIENEYNMLQTAAAGLTYNPEVQSFEFNPFWVLDIDREYLLIQTLDKLSKAEPKDLRRKLRVVFKGEDGVDAGGVTREFFQLLSTQLFDADTGMWTDRYQDGQITWFNADCSWNDEGYFLSGILMGLAVYNSVLLDVHFPQALYRKLLRLPLGLEDMVDEEVKSGLQALLDYDKDDVEDVFCLTFDVAWMDLGVEKRRDLKPNGSTIPVTAENKEEYVLLYTRWLLQDSIYPQYEAFERGFMRVMENSSFEILRPDELELLVVGAPDLDFTALRKNTTYEGGFTDESDVVKNFWQFIENSTTDVLIQFLKFATGSPKAPIGGLGALPFKIQRAGPDSDHLPTSHTCFNTLLLPDYGADYDKLANRLGRAILECEGFGLQ